MEVPSKPLAGHKTPYIRKIGDSIIECCLKPSQFEKQYRARFSGSKLTHKPPCSTLQEINKFNLFRGAYKTNVFTLFTDEA
ncbi:MAG: hypothetical protein C0399_03355 [Syntrophus sp. (in: bacteria)]|nr:hypothetical protein [Syntrophus sp. (in: bacteria)]